MGSPYYSTQGLPELPSLTTAEEAVQDVSASWKWKQHSSSKVALVVSVWVRSSSLTEVDCIKAELEGQLKVQFSEEGEEVSSWFPDFHRTKQVKFKAEQNFLLLHDILYGDYAEVLYRTQSGHYRLLAGAHKFKTQFLVPRDHPASLKNEFASVLYNLDILVISRGKVVGRNLQKVPLTTKVLLREGPGLPGGYRKERIFMETGWQTWRSQVVLELSVYKVEPYRVMYRGHACNKSSCQVEVKVVLKQSLTFKAFGKHNKAATRTQTSDVSSQDHGGVKPDCSLLFNSELLTTHAWLPTSAQSLITTDHWLELQTNGEQGAALVRVPLKLWQPEHAADQ